MFVRTLEQIGDRSAIDVLADDIGSSKLLTEVENCDDVWVIAQLRHGLRFTLKASDALGAKLLGLKERNNHIALQALVTGEIHFFLAPLAQQAHDLVTAASKRCG